MDSNTYQILEIGRDNQWVDDRDEYGPGTEIESEIVFKERVPPIGAAAKLEHRQSHLRFKPWLKDHRNTGDYDAEGYRAGFNVDLFIRQDASPVNAATTFNVPIEGQLVFDRRLRSRYLQPGCIVRNAPWRLVEEETWYEQIDSAASPANKLMSQMTRQQDLSEPLLWLTRDQNPMLNYATGQAVAGAWLLQIPGPDGMPRSGTTIGMGQGYAVAVAPITGEFTFVLWVQNPTNPVVLYNDGILSLTLVFTTQWELRWADGATNLTFFLGDTLTSWQMITVRKEAGNAVVYLDKELINTGGLANPNITYGGTATLFNNVISYFDLRIVSRSIDERTIDYLYDDAVQNNSNATCPPA